MFGYVNASFKELTKQQQSRYQAVYCGICRAIRARAGQTARLCLSYDMTFLAFLLMSLYEPEEVGGRHACALHPIHRDWTDTPYIRYAADMNVLLAYYNCLDDWNDDGRRSRKWMAQRLQPQLAALEEQYPRQCRAVRECIATLDALEAENCADADRCANCFGALMAQLLVFREDMWAADLREMGMALGRFVYLADAAADYRKDLRKHRYNPYIAMGTGEDFPRWDEYLVLTMARCTDYYEKLPLVQDKPLLDNILYSGVWLNLRQKRKEQANG